MVECLSGIVRAKNDSIEDPNFRSSSEGTPGRDVLEAHQAQDGLQGFNEDLSCMAKRSVFRYLLSPKQWANNDPKHPGDF